MFLLKRCMSCNVSIITASLGHDRVATQIFKAFSRIRLMCVKVKEVGGHMLVHPSPFKQALKNHSVGAEFYREMM